MELTKKRSALKTNDAEAIQQFNAEAAAYAVKNAAHKTLATELESTRSELQTLLAERSKKDAALKAQKTGKKPGKSEQSAHSLKLTRRLQHLENRFSHAGKVAGCVSFPVRANRVEVISREHLGPRQ